MPPSEAFAYRHPAWYAVSVDLLALASGAVLPLAFSPFDYWPLAIPVIALLLWLWQGQTPLRAAWLGGLFGLGLFTAGISWVYISLHDYGNAPAIFAVLVTLGLILLMAGYTAVAGYVLARWSPFPGPIRCLLIAPALGTGLEWVRSWLFTGFPWLTVGYSQVDSPLGNIAPYLGVFGVSWAVWLSAGLLLLLLQNRSRWVWGAVAVLLWVSVWCLGRIDWVTPDGKSLRISLVQGNISQDQKWRPERLEDTLRLYARLSLEQGQDSAVIIWPEAAIPALYEEVRDFVSGLEDEARSSGIDYLVGIPTGARDTGIFHNSVISLGSSPGFYHKHRLLPFGEYLPLRYLLRFFHRFVEIPMADFTPGGTEQPLLRVAGQPVGVSICFEVAFGSEIRRALPQARFLVNVSNDAWFGDSLAPHQHLQIARMRSLEMGRYMARATNTGISAFIDARGRIIARSRPFEALVLSGEVQPLAGTTPYVRMGDGVTVGLVAALLALGLVLEHRRNKLQPDQPCSEA